jgi:hypothetical protein
VVFSNVLAIDLYVNTFGLYVRGAPDCAGLAMAGKDILQWELHLQVPVLFWSAPEYGSDVRREGGNRQRTAMENTRCDGAD